MKTDRLMIGCFFLIFVALTPNFRADRAQAKELDPDEVLDQSAMMPTGIWEEVTIPDTLDLVERAKWSINVLTHNAHPDRFYAVYGITLGPDYQDLSFGSWDITPKNARTLPTLRVMTGSDHNLDIEYNLMRALLTGIRKDELLYYPTDMNKKARHPILRRMLRRYSRCLIITPSTVTHSGWTGSIT